MLVASKQTFGAERQIKRQMVPVIMKPIMNLNALATCMPCLHMLMFWRCTHACC